MGTGRSGQVAIGLVEPAAEIRIVLQHAKETSVQARSGERSEREGHSQHWGYFLRFTARRARLCTT